MEKPQQPYCVADLHGSTLTDDVKEHINCLRAHPTTDSQFAYGTSRGRVILSDTRTPRKFKLR